MTQIVILENYERTGRTAKVQMLTWSPDRIAIASIYDHKKVVQVWDVTTGHEVSAYSSHTAAIGTLAWLGEKCIASVDFPGTVHVWDPLTGSQIISYNGLLGLSLLVALGLLITLVSFQPKGPTSHAKRVKQRSKFGRL